jgi:hypothetical protein
MINLSRKSENNLAPGFDKNGINTRKWINGKSTDAGRSYQG